MKNKLNYFKLLIIVLFFVFIVMYISRDSDYYEYENYKKVLITESAIKTFEDDVKEGKNIDSKIYLKDEYKDYSSGFSNLGIKASIVVDEIVKKGISSFLKIIKIFLT